MNNRHHTPFSATDCHDALPLKIAILNAVSLNGGDAAILLGTITAIRQALAPRHVSFCISENRSELAQSRYPALTFIQQLTDLQPPKGLFRGIKRNAFRLRGSLGICLLRKWPTIARTVLTRSQRKWIQAVSSCDLAISTGGTYLVDHYSFLTKVHEIEAAHALAKPVVLYTQSLGPFATTKAARRMSRIARATRLFFVRDIPSHDSLVRIGVNPQHIHQAPDAAFALPSSPRTCEASPDTPLPIAFSVRAWRHFRGIAPDEGTQRYHKAIQGALRFLIESARPCLFVSTCQGNDGYAYDDSKTADMIMQALLPTGESPPDTVVNDAGWHAPEDLITRYHGCTMLIATRMHAAILGLLAGIPVIAIAYEDKTTQLFQSIGLGEFVIDIESVSADWLIDKMADIERHRPAIVARIAGITGQLRTQALATPQRLFSLLADC